LHEAGWIACNGRERTRGGHLRRTATIIIPKETRKQLSPYGVLPWWACGTIRRAGKLPWSTRAVLSVVMGRLLGFKAVVQRQDDHDPADWLGEIDELVGLGRFGFSLRRLCSDTGLSRESAVAAKHHLTRLGIVGWQAQKREDGGDDQDLLIPNPAFRVVKTATGNGHCYLDFKTVRGGSDSG